MKVKITADSKKVLTLDCVPVAKQIIAELRADHDLADYAKAAARVASRSNADFEIFKAEAQIAKNCRVWNAYATMLHSADLDVWVDACAFNQYEGFYSIGFYLTDIWSLSGDNSEEVRGHMFIQEYKATK